MNEYFESDTPNTDNTKKVRSFSKGVDMDNFHFVTAIEPTGNFELIAVDKLTRKPVEKLARTFPSYADVDAYINKGISNKKR
jgi:hypothetical protein